MTVLTGAVGVSDPSSSLPEVHDGVSKNELDQACLSVERGCELIAGSKQAEDGTGAIYRGGRRGSVAKETAGQH